MYSFQKSLNSNTDRGKLARMIMALEPTPEEAGLLDKALFSGTTSLRGVWSLVEFIKSRQSRHFSGEDVSQNIE